MDNGSAEVLIEYSGTLSCTIFSMKLNLHDINGLIVPAKNRDLYLWKSMIWFITLEGVNVTPKRNLVSETTSNVFLVLLSDVIKCCMCTSDLADHGFVNMRKICM